MSVDASSAVDAHLQVGRSAQVRRWFWPCIFLLASVIFIARAGSQIHTFSQTFDEPYHIGAALAIYETGSHVAGVQHGPAARLAAGLPLYLAGVRAPLPSTNLHEVRTETVAFEMGAWALFKGPTPYWRVLALARWAMLLVFCPICLLYVFLLGKLLGGPGVAGSRVGATAAVFFSLDPTFLGHSFLVCTDVPGCAAFLAVLYHGARWIESPTWPRCIIAGAVFGIAIACKFSCLELLPALFVIAVSGCGKALFEIHHPAEIRPRFSFVQIAVMACAAFLSLWAMYLFAIGKLSNQSLFRPIYFHRVPAFIAGLTVPMPGFFLGLLYLIGHERVGHPNYLNGHVSEFGHWYYFPEAIALKEPLSVLAAFALAMVLFVCMRSQRSRWRIAAIVLIPAGIFLAAAMKGSLNLGIRHILPVLPCMYLFICLVIVGPMADKFITGFQRAAAAGLLIVLTCIETLPAGPDYIAYFNVAAGGAAGGRRYLADSNLDWGQDFALLAAYLHSPQNAGRKYSICAFDQHPELLCSAFGLREDAVDGNPRGLFALTVNSSVRLQGYRVDNADASVSYAADYDWVKQYRHVVRIGTCFDVYDLDAPRIGVAVDGQ